MPRRSDARADLPLPGPLRPWQLVPCLVAGILGTGLLYQGAVDGRLLDLLLGVPLFGVGLWGAGWPFVLASAHLARNRPSRSPEREG